MKPLRSSLFSCVGCGRGIYNTIRSKSILQTSRRSYARPSIAPKPSIDIKHIRQNPGLYAQNCIDRNYDGHAKHSWRILELHNKWLQCQRDARGLRERSNDVRRKIAMGGSRSGDADGEIIATGERGALFEEGKALKAQLTAIEEKEVEIQAEIEALALELPNLSSTHTPTGSLPEVIGFINDHPEPKAASSDRVWRSHVHIGSELGLLDFVGAATASGWGWYYLTNEAALLEQALVQYALSTALKHGWKVVSPPSIVYSHIATACGFQPRDSDGVHQIYALEQAEKDKAKPPLVLTGTAEIPLAAMKAGQVIEASELPLKLVGVSRCYRAEAGARGVDTKGLYRVHEFTKVELFAWTLPESPDEEHFTTAEKNSQPDALFQEMISIQTEILQSLGLHCRILEMPSTDLGASANRKQDIEAFFPSRRDRDDGWGEVTSASICTDYQSRRLATRIRFSSRGGKLDFPYTLNGTALAVPRVLAAILENNWNEQKMSITVPEVLRPWMGGMEVISRKNK